VDKLIPRIKNMIVKPGDTWQTIKTEEATIKSIISQYLIFLAIVPAVAFYFRNSLTELAAVALAGALLFAVLNIVGIYITAKLVQVLAPKFEATVTEVDVFKLIAYAMTPAILGTALILLSLSTPLTFIIALYSLYLLYIGFPVLVTCSDAKRLPFSLLSMVIMYAIFVAVHYIALAFIWIF
jgi:hypothetical protein